MLYGIYFFTYICLLLSTSLSICYFELIHIFYIFNKKYGKRNKQLVKLSWNYYPIRFYCIFRQVKGCPLKVAVTAVADASRVVCSGDGLRVGTVGKEIRSFIDTRRAGPGMLHNLVGILSYIILAIGIHFLNKWFLIICQNRFSSICYNMKHNFVSSSTFAPHNIWEN